MKISPQIVFDGVTSTPQITDKITSEIAKLERYYKRIISCRVTISKPQRRHKHGDLYAAAVHLTLPGGKEIVAARNPTANHAHEDVNIAIRDAFLAAQRQLKDETEKMQKKEQTGR